MANLCVSSLFVVAFVALCGAKPSFRILHGNPVADISEFPYVVSLETSGIHDCGGVIIRADIILTAAHCTEGFAFQTITIRAGTTIAEDTKGDHVQVRKVKKYVTHPSYKLDSKDNDVALVYLNEKFELNDYVNVIDLASQDYGKGDSAVIMGWGKNEHFDDTQNLMKGSISIIANEECTNLYGDKFTITGSMVCTIGGDSHHGTCEDDGSPMVIHDPSSPKTDKLVGLAVYSDVIRTHLPTGGADFSHHKICDSSKPSVFTKITAIKDFVMSQME